MTIKVYIGADTGASGFGECSRGIIRSLVERDDIELNVRTHDIGFSKSGAHSGKFFPDTRFREYLIRNGLVNEDFLIDDNRESAKRDTDNLLEDLQAGNDMELMIKQFERGEEDVWMAIGGPEFINYAPDDKYTILSTDWNLDVVPHEIVSRKKMKKVAQVFNSPLTNIEDEDVENLGVNNMRGIEEYMLDATPEKIEEDFDYCTDQTIQRLQTLMEDCMVESPWGNVLDADEVWVPSEWTRQSILSRFPDIEDKVHAMWYGVDMRYRPGMYDHEVCPSEAHQAQNPQNHPCLHDGTFNFLVISRYYHIKGLYRTIAAYIEAFTQTDDVRLVVKTTSNNQFDFDAHGAIERMKQKTEYPDPPEHGVHAFPLSNQKIHDLLGHVDCFLQLSRAECFGIAQMQALYCGTPVLYTDWSAQRELLDDCGGAIPLNEFSVKKPEPENSDFMYEGGEAYPVDSNWAVPDVGALASKMREIYERDDLEDLGEKGSRYVKENFRWSDRIEPRVERLKESGA